MSTPISSASTPEALPEKPGGRHTGLIIAAIIIVLAIIASIIFAVTKNTGQDSAPSTTASFRSPSTPSGSISGHSSSRPTQIGSAPSLAAVASPTALP